MAANAISSTLTLFFLFTITLLHLHVQPAHTFLDGEKVGPLKVASFNVRHFGRGFLDDKAKETVSRLLKVMGLYDIVLVIETRDQTGTAIKDLRDKLTESTGEKWAYIASEELGKTKAYLEQYVFFYRVKSASVVSTYQVKFTTVEEDKYARDPFCVEFAYTSSSRAAQGVPAYRESVVFLPIHTPPEDTKEELLALSETVKNVAAIYPRSAGVIAMGDFNADCRYFAGKYRTSYEIFNGKDFTSLIPDDADTATKGTSDCAYDRVVLYGKNLNVTDANVFNFQTWLKLSEEEALDVSDHFPVHFTMH